MITHDLQALLEDLLCTNISHLTSSILTLNFAQAKQATRRCGAVSNDALYEEVLVLVTYLLICFT